MQLNISNFLAVGLLSLILGANSLPAAVSRRDLSQDLEFNDVLRYSGLKYGTKADIDVYTALAKLEKRARPKKGKKPTLPPINTSPGDSSKPPVVGNEKKPKKEPGSKSPKTPSDTGSPKVPKIPKTPKTPEDPGSPKPPKTPKTPEDTGSPKSPKTPETAPPSASPKNSIKLGKCGSRLPGKLLTNETPGSPKSPKIPKTPVSPKGPAPGDEREEAQGKKKMNVCKKKPTTLRAPTYPTSGDVITRNKKKWQPIIKAFNAAKPDPCENDYTFKQVSFPKKNTDGLWTPEQALKAPRTAEKDSWDTEHVMDVQVVQKFFNDMFFKKESRIPRTELPERWRQGAKAIPQTQDQCDYLQQFWQRRWNSAPNAMDYLLQVYPGEDQYADEMVLLPGRLNGKKASLFSSNDVSSVISVAKWKAATFHEKIDELRELVLLTEYLNLKKIQDAFKAVSGRIKDRLDELESPDWIRRKTRDFWLEKAKVENKDETGLADEPEEQYISLGLSKRWETFIYDFVTERVKEMETMKDKNFRDLEAVWKKLKVYKDLTPADKKEAEVRMMELKKHIKTDIKIAGLVEKPVASSPGKGPSITLPILPGPPSGE